MRHNIRCAICGNRFNNISSKAKYCCAECRDEGRKRTREEWEKQNPTYARDAMRRHRARQKEQTEMSSREYL